MEYIIGPVISLLIAFKFVDVRQKQLHTKLKDTRDQIAFVEMLLEQRETELPKKLVATMVPLAKEVKKLKEEVGIQ
jgi:cell division protein FtsB